MDNLDPSSTPSHPQMHTPVPDPASPAEPEPAAASTSGPDPAPPPAPVPAPTPTRRPLFGTILWGVILVVLAGAVGADTLPDVDLPASVIGVGSLVVLGVLLVIAGIAAAIRSTPRP